MANVHEKLSDGTWAVRVKVTNEDVYNVKNGPYNATGDGVTDDTASIQAALDAAETAGNGTVIIPDGVYGITDTLVISASVHIKLSQGAEVKLLPANGKTLLETVAVDATPLTVTSVTSSNTTATITATAHGYVEGDWVFLHSSDTDGYNGVYQVLAGAAANTFTVTLPYAPLVSPATGTIILLPAVGQVTLEGGAWNYDNDNNNSSGATNSHAVILYGVHTAKLKDIKGLHTEKFSMYLIGIQHLIVKDIYFDTDSDGLHICGPIYDADIKGVRGSTLDNMIAVCTSEGTWPAILPSRGSINSILIDGLYPDNSIGGTIRTFGEHSGSSITASGCTVSAAGVTVTATAHGLAPRDVIKFDTVGAGMTEMSGRVFVVGQVASADTFEIQDLDNTGYTAWSGTATFEKVSHYRIKNFTVKNARFAQDNAPNDQMLFSALVAEQGLDSVIIDNLILDNVSGDEAMNGQIMVLNVAQPGAMFIDNITFKSMVVDLPAGGAVGDFEVIYVNKAAGDTYGQLINNLNFFNCKIRGYDKSQNARCIYVTGAGQIKRMRITDSHISNLHSMIHCNNSGIVDGYEFYLSGCTFNNGFSGISVNVVKCKIFANNVSAIDMQFGLTRTNSAFVQTVYANNLDWGAVDPMDSVGGTGTIRAVGLGIRTVATNLTPVSGDYVWDVTDSRPETYNGAAWVAM